MLEACLCAAPATSRVAWRGVALGRGLCGLARASQMLSLYHSVERRIHSATTREDSRRLDSATKQLRDETAQRPNNSGTTPFFRIADATGLERRR